MAERSKAHAWKACRLQKGLEGSNPSLSAIFPWGFFLTDSFWNVYVLKCSDGSYYTGISQDLEERINRHQMGRGAEYTKFRLPVDLVYTEKAESHSQARTREKWLKPRDLKQKEELFQGWSKESPEGG